MGIATRSYSTLEPSNADISDNINMAATGITGIQSVLKHTDMRHLMFNTVPRKDEGFPGGCR